MLVTVTIVSPVSEPLENTTGEVWGINRAGARHKLDRLYFMDDPQSFGPALPGLVEEAAEVVKRGGGVFGRRAWEQIPGCREYPLHLVARELESPALHKPPPVTSTAAFAMMHAIALRHHKITLHGILCWDGASDYFTQRPCIDYLVGFARGRGIDVEMTGGTTVCQPWNGQSRLYGYIQDDWEEIAEHALKCVNSIVRHAKGASV